MPAVNHTFFSLLQISGKEICSLTKEQFLDRAPPFMGDILWAHMEILQKEVETRAANIENVPSNYSQAEQSFDSRTYTQLDTTSPGGSASGVGASSHPPPPPLLPSTPAAMAIAQQAISTSPSGSSGTTSTTSTYTTRGQQCMYPGMEQYTDIGSDYGYSQLPVEMKYSHQMAAAAARVPYPPSSYYSDQFSEQDWQAYGNPESHAWQPSSTTGPADFHPVSASVSPPSSRPHTTLTPSSVIQTSTTSITSTSSPMHQHPAFLQVGAEQHQIMTKILVCMIYNSPVALFSLFSGF